MSTNRHGRRPRFTSPLTEARQAAARMTARPFNWFRPTTRFAVGFVTLVVFSTLLLARTHTPTSADDYQEGEVVRADVVSPADLSSEDARETGRRRAAVIDSTLPVWTFDSSRVERAINNFRASWNALQKQVETRGGNANGNGGKGEFIWPGEGAEREAVARAVIAHRFDGAALQSLLRMMRDSGEGYIYEERDAPNVKPEIRVVNQRSGAAINVNIAQARFTSLTAARESLRGRISELPGWTPAEREALASAMLPLLEPTVTFNGEATEAARIAAGTAVAPTVVSLKRNQIIAREGDTVTPQMLAQFAAIRAYSHSERRPQHFIGLLLFVGALYWAAWRYIEYRSTITTLPITRVRAFTLVALSVFVQLILMRVGYTVTESISAQSTHAPTNDATLWSFAIPFAAGALVVTLLVDTQLALVTAMLTALLAGLIAPNGMLTTLFAMISSSAAIYGIGRYRERHSVTQAGLVVGAVNVLTALAVMLTAQQPLTLNAVLLAGACGLAGGIMTTIFTAGALPVNESLFGILTDVKLLELSNADLPVLGQLALRAPGTNQHSHAVGQLAQEACRAIGANPLLARIGALYHDIGKLAAPDMFVENQTGSNPHDRLRPSQSARIITSHVTYGLKLAKQIGLPKPIADFIPQHHGTRTLHYFLRKAQAEAPEGEAVEEAEFRYPGPKPQFKEAAIMMLADSCEAAARSLKHPDPCNVRTIVTKIFDAIVSDGQLDECDLSLRELTKIRETMITSLTAIYHARIDYPGFNPPSLNPALPSLPPADIDSEERGVSYSKPSEIPISKGGEVEDEALASKTAK